MAPSPGLNVVKQALPACIHIGQSVADLSAPGQVTGAEKLLTQPAQVGLLLTEKVDLLHKVLVGREQENWSSQSK